jgi:2-polyprenyl-6-hydroxyphenyl methylase/3-demethylubiquinone-9 3-methyltransferase
MSTSAHAQELAAGGRFDFGANWTSFLSLLNDERIGHAESALQQMLQVERLDGRTFLDVGSGSGLSSLAARRLGATVRSFDYDPKSVACTSALRDRYFPGDPAWVVESGSVLDGRYLASLGTYDVVYSWGVLHHTGAMWQALEQVTALVGEQGKLFIALYNDQGWGSRYWTAVKRLYAAHPVLRWPLLLAHVAYPLAPSMVARALKGRPADRGMSLWHDHVDWIGGYPFEVATPERVVAFCRRRGFALANIRTTRRLGCNEFVFARTPDERNAVERVAPS